MSSLYTRGSFGCRGFFTPRILARSVFALVNSIHPFIHGGLFEIMEERTIPLLAPAGRRHSHCKKNGVPGNFASREHRTCRKCDFAGTSKRLALVG
jgi:hypothetical protein